MRKGFFLITVFVLFLSCKKDDNNTNQYENIPQVPVNIYLNLDQPSNFNLTAIGGSINVEGGSRGILIYRDVNAYRAFERHSPHKSTEQCAVVTADSSNIFGVEECDGIQYYLSDGTVASGNSAIPLLQYQTRETQGILHIYN